MERVKFYQDLIISILKENADYYKGTTNPLNLYVIEDKKNNHFQLLMLGWENDHYVFQCLFHLDIINGKIWVQWNDTDFPIEQELIKRDVPAGDIVLGLKHPKRRENTGFAAA